ncbi:hypothetical protein [Luteimicrobium xylanilyticum]|nr:hypothetical protein [Luteimicrobium xylanilyticum]
MYGFRVYELWATQGATGRAHLEIDGPLAPQEHLIDVLVALTADLGARGLLTDIPKLQHPEEWETAPFPDLRTPQMQIVEARELDRRRLFLKFKFGRYGEYGEAIGPSGSIDLHDAAAVHEYRAMFFLPEHGKVGRIAVEAIGTTCPDVMLLPWLGYASYQRDKNAWFRLKWKQVADRARIIAMLKNAEKVQAELTQKRPAEPGRGAGVKAKLRALFSGCGRVVWLLAPDLRRCWSGSSSGK